MYRYLLYFLFALLASCRAGEYDHQEALVAGQRLKKGDSTRQDRDSLLPSRDTGWGVSGHYEDADTFYYPGVGEAHDARLLSVGTYHADEMDSTVLLRSWTGLFKGAQGYYLRQAPIRAERIEDAVLDEEGQKTGWQLTTQAGDSSVVLLSGVEGLQEGPVEAVRLSRERLLPGEELVFPFQGGRYKLYAAGDSRKEGDETIVLNYKLFLQYEVKGKEQHQLLVSHPTLDGALAQILFIGDLNRDGRPDLLLDTSWHYNALVPALYLSEAGGGRGTLLRVVALHMSVGC